MTKPILSTLTLAAVLTVSNSANAEQTIRLTTGEWEPYVSAELENYGFAANIVARAFAAENIKVEYSFFPWDEAISLARKGEWHGSMVWHHTKQRAENFFYSEPFLSNPTVLFHRKDLKFDWNKFDDLQNLLIGATHNYDYGEAFVIAHQNGKLNLVYESSDEKNFQRLLSGKIALFPNNLYVGYSQLKNNFTSQKIQQITHHPKFLYVKELHVIFSKKVKENELYVAAFNRGIKKLRKTGKLEQYVNSARAVYTKIERKPVTELP